MTGLVVQMERPALMDFAVLAGDLVGLAICTAALAASRILVRANRTIHLQTQTVFAETVYTVVAARAAQNGGIAVLLRHIAVPAVNLDSEIADSPN